MKRVLRHPFRFAVRLIWFTLEVLFATFDFVIALCVCRGEAPAVARARARRLQRHTRRVLRALKVDVSVSGHVPDSGLLASNHLSYLDVLVLSSISAAVFVSKSEVRHWPVFGWLARRAGTLFIERAKRGDVARVNDEAERLLESGALLVVFPEGTSSDGREVLPFKSALLEPIVGRRHPLAVAHLSYEVDEGDAGEDVCYWGDMTFGPHLLKLLTKGRVRAFVTFTAVENSADCRKELARQLHSEVSRLKSAREAQVTA
jgi:1-acyl-sn-glycerol-3-phosphate acyltransferase